MTKNDGLTEKIIALLAGTLVVFGNSAVRPVMRALGGINLNYAVGNRYWTGGSNIHPYSPAHAHCAD